MKKTSSFLTGFLAMLVAAGLLSSAGTAQAALISINIGPTGFNIGGINAGLSSGSSSSVGAFPFSGGSTLDLWNDPSGNIGLSAGTNFYFFLSSATNPASPKNFASNALINWGGGAFSAEPYFTSFYNTAINPGTSPDFGPNSYLGFAVQDSATSFYHFGWLEATWNGTSKQFQILSGAYESDPGVGILAGAGPSAAVPEPGTWAAAALLAGGAAFMRWRKRAKVA
jgi:hypothetical protein